MALRAVRRPREAVRRLLRQRVAGQKRRKVRQINVNAFLKWSVTA